MSWRRSSVRRSPAEWGIRAVLVVVAIVFGYFSLARTLAYTIRSEQPERAYTLAPSDARVGGAFSERLSGPDATQSDRRTADRIALSALRRDPVNVSAAATLGLNAQIRGDGRLATRWFDYSQLLSRRDLRTQLWAIENAVARGDVPGALKHYDIALRTSRKASDILFPVLEAALSDGSIRKELIRTLSRKPMWSDVFISHAAENGPDRGAVALLFAGLNRVGVPVADRSRALIVTRLIDANQIDAAWAYYAAVHPGARPDMSRDPRFAATSGDPTAFDWQPVNDAGVSASIQRGDRGGLVDFGAPAGVGGPLLRQMQVLGSGRYALEGHSIGIEQRSGAQPYWVLTCADGRRLGRVDVPNSAQAGGAFAGSFVVPSDCPAQTLSLIAPASDDVAGLSGQIDRVVLRRVN